MGKGVFSWSWSIQKELSLEKVDTSLAELIKFK